MSVLISKNQTLVFQRATIIIPNVEMIGIINKRGRMIESIGSDALSMTESQKEMFLMKIALRNSMQSDFDDVLGSVKYCMTQRGNRKFISIPAPNNNTILVVITNNCDHEKLVNNIIQTLKNSTEFLGESLLKEDILI